MGKEEADSGTVQFGKTIKPSYLPQDNREYFDNCHLSIVDWLRQYSKDKTESYVRGWLGRMLFSGEESLKEVNVLSGGEKVRCMLAKLMLEGGNLLILDEPVNHLDLESITSLNKGMINFKGPILLQLVTKKLLKQWQTELLTLWMKTPLWIKKCPTKNIWKNIKVNTKIVLI